MQAFRTISKDSGVFFALVLIAYARYDCFTEGADPWGFSHPNDKNVTLLTVEIFFLFKIGSIFRAVLSSQQN